jgi:hypothetical protein
MMSRCSTCKEAFDILDTFRCNNDACNHILCGPCALTHVHAEPTPRTCFDPECEGCYNCSPNKIKCDCRQYANLGHCMHLEALSEID